MGSGFSEPINPQPSLGYLAIALRTSNVVRLIHAPPEVIAATISVVKEVETARGYGGRQIEQRDKHGAFQIKLQGSPFRERSGKDNATAGKLFTLRMLEELQKLGYDPVVSSDLSRIFDQATWFFKKVSPERPMKRITCLAPGQADRLITLRADRGFNSALKQAIEESWKRGIQREETEESCGETLCETKLHGNPWWDSEGGEDSVMSREMLIQIFGRLGEVHYKLLMGTNIKGGTDSMFFMHDSNYRVSPADFAIITLNKSDRLRLINCTEVADSVKMSINKEIGVQREENKYGAHEFKLNGYPWRCSGHEAIASRRLIADISTNMLARGWALTTALDLSRKLNDKSVLVYVKSVPVNTKFACVALSDTNKIRLMGFPVGIRQALRDVIFQNYMPGLQDEKEKDDDCQQMKLNGSPWTQSACENIHARSTLAHLMRCASQHGWRVVASADVSAKYVSQENGPDYPIDVHSWYLVHWPDN